MKSRDGGLREWGSPGQTSSIDFGTDEAQAQSIMQVTFRSSSTNKLLVLRSGWNNGKPGLMIWFSLSASKGTKSKIARPSRQVSIPQFVAWNANLNSALHSACKHTTNPFWSFPSDLTTISTWTPDSAYLASLATYTLCDQVNSTRYSQDEAWLSEYKRVCYLPVNGSFPTTGYNFSITLTDASSVGISTPSRIVYGHCCNLYYHSCDPNEYGLRKWSLWPV
ncbi:hypothetical protein N7455_007225 [Penicillium solitum]|uniref:uncharacterized protein n=1 Tax=Penicillium solitum TaxID=60172 RepID=UPI0032C3F17D|nr:hypothetical protein N7455_007225 [Penicillium solitum]